MRPELAGLVHGAAELLPVSSSAHARALGATHEEAVAMAAGAAPVVALAWRRDVLPLRPGLQLAALVPPVVVGALAPPRLRTTTGLALGSALLLLPARGERRADAAGWRDGLVLGLAQAAGLSSGVSRLGATTAAARVLGFAGPDAASLAREVALPVTAAAVARTVRGARSWRAALGSAAGAALLAPLAPRIGHAACAAERLALAAFLHVAKADPARVRPRQERARRR